MTERQPQDLPRRRAERQADAELVGPLRHQVRHHAVDADDGEHEREAAEDGHDRGDVLQPNGSFLEHLPHRHDVEHRLLGVDGANRRAGVGDDADGVAVGACQQREVRRRRLRKRPVQRRRIAPPEPVVDDVAADADDGEPRRVWRPHDPEPAANRVGVRPEAPRHRQAHDRDRLRVFTVRAGEAAPLQDGHAERVEDPTAWRRDSPRPVDSADPRWAVLRPRCRAPSCLRRRA